MTLIQKREYLARIVSTPIAEVDEKSDLCQRFRRTARTYSKEMPDKVRAIELDAQLDGSIPIGRHRRRNSTGSKGK